MRQFSSEGGTLVYRRFGRGPAFPVTEEQVADFLQRYMRETRIARLALLVTTIVLGGGAGPLMAQLPFTPGETAIVLGIVIPVVLLIAAFVVADLRNQSRPERELSVRAPVASAIDADEWSRAQLRQAPWPNFIILPLASAFVVWALRDLVDPLTGWGRLIWLFPAAAIALAVTQGLRKLRAG
ncbi:hypothetical protein GCM10011515_08650 [Tsuneonella deserti]|uniref:Uncharacterized protein n=1 Tax=Tsuneonella deserti TaxID=2035528 RepID=A0ABQ1S3J9_9SPHN|nr:hypothetical protein [Tsuneonella deserti]GGD91262.1 hypothetical protein GCM10011515_08650 [Tsuneonella deserti]